MTPRSGSPTSPHRVSALIERLQQVYPGATCALTHHNPLELLMATILSAQCTDERVNLVTPTLFKRFPTASDYASANIAELEELVRSTGFYKNKAKSILGCAKQIVAKHGGKVPQTLDELTALPGVGRKTANVVLGTAFGIPSGIVVDTHVRRLSNRLGLTTQDDPEKIEQDLLKIIPEKHWIEFSHLLILHGRNRCSARKPDCPGCEVEDLCPKKL
ncbi:MAG TPA: endonuclease III [Candidatus Ozemobacteraceae bacterium]|nr:endonuclease III [Candidatus Ozemobacteraceae bacterium]